MASWWITCSIVMLSAFGTTWCFEWETQPEPVVYSCVGREVTFPWGFKTGDAEHIRDIRWFYDGDFDSMMVAMMENVYGYFLPNPSYSQRVRQLANGGLALSDVTLADAGNYSVEVNVEVEGSLVSHRHSVLLQVGDGLMTQDGTLTASQDPVAVWDSSDQRWTIRLTCGRFTFLGQPPVHVIWTTPTMETPASSGYDNGHFYLTLSSPVVGGTYTCNIPHHLLSDVCVTESNHDNHALTARVLVSEVKVRLSLLEAEHRTLKVDNREHQGEVQDDANNKLTSEKTELKQQQLVQHDVFMNLTSKITYLIQHQQVQDDVIRNLTSEKRELKQHQQVQDDAIRNLESKNQVQDDAIRNLESKNQVQDDAIRNLEYKNQVQDDAIKNLESKNKVQDAAIRNLESKNIELRGELQQTRTSQDEATDALSHYMNGQRAALRAVLRTANITAGAPIKMTPLQQTASDYDITTGKYTVPVSGWYAVAYQLFPTHNGKLDADLFNSGNLVARARCDNKTSTTQSPHTCHSSLALHLVSGDRLWVQSGHSGIYWTGDWDTFLTIVLVTPDQ